MSIEALIEDFSFLDDWETRYRYVIELGQSLEPLPADAYTDENKVRGCASQVWLIVSPNTGADGKLRLHFAGDSDAHIVKGLIAVLLQIYSDKTPEEILETDAREIMEKLGLDENLSPQRSNGFFSMVERIRRDAEEAADLAASS